MDVPPRCCVLILHASSSRPTATRSSGRGRLKKYGWVRRSPRPASLRVQREQRLHPTFTPLSRWWGGGWRRIGAGSELLRKVSAEGVGGAPRRATAPLPSRPAPSGSPPTAAPPCSGRDLLRSPATLATTPRTACCRKYPSNAQNMRKCQVSPIFSQNFVPDIEMTRPSWSMSCSLQHSAKV